MATKVTTTWLEGMAFKSESDGHSLIMDVGKDGGGKDLGPRPKPLLLTALSGCSGMDVVSILGKMRISDYNLRIEMEADSTPEHPKYYDMIRMFFIFKGENLPADQIIHAVELSTTRYCGVNAMLKQAAQITSTIIINEKEIWNAKSG